MNCLIDSAIKFSLKQGKRADVIAHYIRNKYSINIDMTALKARIRVLQKEMNFS